MFSHKSKYSSAAIDMCEGPIFPILLKIAIPIMLSGLLQMLFNAADIMVVGKFGSDQSVAAVSATTSMIHLIINIFIGMSVGSNVICARLFGERNHGQMEKAVHTSIFISIIIGIFLTVVGFFSAEFLLKLLDTPESILPLATRYMQIYFLGMVPMILYNFSSAILRAVGDTKRPLYFLTIAGITNVILNLLLVIVFHLDVAGVAIATTISNTISAFFCLRALMTASDSTHLDLKKLRIDIPTLKDIIKIGLPAGIQSALFSIANVVIQSSINSISASLSAAEGVATGDAFLAGNGAAVNIESFVFTALNAVDQAIIAFTGQNYGRREYKRIVKAQGCAVLINLTFGALLCIGTALISNKLLLLYVSSPEAIAFGVERVAIITSFCFVNAISNVFVGGMRGCGYSFISMITSLVCICVMRLIWIFTIFQVYPTYEVLLACYPISYIVSVAVHGILLFFVLKRVKKKLTSPIVKSV